MKIGIPSGFAGLACLLLASSEPVGAAGAPAPDLSAAWRRAADSLVLEARVSLPPGWYINSHAPLDSFLVPTRIEAAVLGATAGSAPGSGAKLEFGPPRWPVPVVEHSAAMAGNMSLFKGTFLVSLAARAPGPGKQRTGVPGTPPPVRVTLHYQSCDGAMCWPPKSVSVVLRDGGLVRE